MQLKKQNIQDSYFSDFHSIFSDLSLPNYVSEPLIHSNLEAWFRMTVIRL